MPRIAMQDIARPGFGGLGARMEEYEKCGPGDMVDGWGNPCPSGSTIDFTSFFQALGFGTSDDAVTPGRDGRPPNRKNSGQSLLPMVALAAGALVVVAMLRRN
jgi:hypothetical protein